ncbi:HNH endonuclease [Pseudomonas sp. RIT-PI-AD]|uniref:HNH endonuclease n=1 Tax=Pseudomonas sp. RIT-PI-AD TaxID=3035294 RepID=UPI0021D98881|nr:HNH endonuclease [Pseudomonas sp. RIT-PI-AD]
MNEPIRLPPQPDACELCRRASPLTRHHLIPKSLHGKLYIRKRYTRQERVSATLWVCRACHNHIHATFGERELALTYNSRDALMADERIRGFVEWLAGKPPGFKPKT